MVRCDDLPLTCRLHPDIRETIVILVVLALRSARLMVRARNHSDIPVHVYAEFRQLCQFYVYGSVRAMADIAFFSVGISIFDGDGEVFSQQRRQQADVTLLVGFGPFLFQCENFCAVGRRLCHSQNWQADKKAESKFMHSKDPAQLFIAQFGINAKYLGCNRRWTNPILFANAERAED